MKKVLGLFIGALAISFSTYGQCLEGDCEDGYGIKKYSSGTIYEGNFVNGERTGWGCAILYNGDISCGNWVLGARELLHHYFSSEGAFLIGLWSESKQTDTRLRVTSSGSVSKGVDRNYRSSKKDEIQDGFRCPGDCGEGQTGVTLSTSYGGYYLRNSVAEGQGVTRGISGWQCSYSENDYVSCGHFDAISYERQLFGMYFPGLSVAVGLKSDVNTMQSIEEHGLLWGDYISGGIRGNVNRTELDFEHIYSKGNGCVNGDCYNGIGTFVYSNGFYQGRYMNGLRQGWGCYVFKESDFVKCGNWKDGDSHMLTYIFWNNSASDGGADVFIGMYKEGERLPWGLHIYEDGSIDYRNTPTRFN